jgi:chromosome segregation ATPase
MPLNTPTENAHIQQFQHQIDERKMAQPETAQVQVQKELSQKDFYAMHTKTLELELKQFTKNSQKRTDECAEYQLRLNGLRVDEKQRKDNIVNLEQQLAAARDSLAACQSQIAITESDLDKATEFDRKYQDLLLNAIAALTKPVITPIEAPEPEAAPTEVTPAAPASAPEVAAAVVPEPAPATA